MKHVMTAFFAQAVLLALSIFVSLQASAATTATPKHVVLCEMEQEAEPTNLETVQTQDIKEVTSLSPFFLNLGNIHLQNQEYTTTDLTFEEMKTMFTTGDYQWDDLQFVTMIVKQSGQIYHIVKSYPGDNQYGMIFTDAGKLVGVIEDGSISLYQGQKGDKVYCYDLQ